MSVQQHSLRFIPHNELDLDSPIECRDRGREIDVVKVQGVVRRFYAEIVVRKLSSIILEDTRSLHVSNIVNSPVWKDVWQLGDCLRHYDVHTVLVMSHQ